MLRRLVGDLQMPRVAATAAAVAAGSAVVAGACTVNVAVTAAGGGSGGGGAGVEKFALGELGSNMYAPLGTLPPAPGDVERAALPLPDPKGRPRVAFQGELGAYSEFAVTMHYGEVSANARPAAPLHCQPTRNCQLPSAHTRVYVRMCHAHVRRARRATPSRCRARISRSSWIWFRRVRWSAG